MSTTKWIFTLGLAVLMALACFGCSDEDDSGTNNNDTRDEWTVLYYAAGTYVEDTTGGESQVIDNIQLMESVVGSDDVNVVAMVNSMAAGGAARYFLIQHDTGSASGNVINSPIVQNVGARNMAASQTLKDFLNFGINTYPAKRYMVVIDGHGDGWRGICRDDLGGSGSSMTVATLAQALSEVKAARGIANFDVIAFSGASMSMIEVAYELRQVAQYMVATAYKTSLSNAFAPDLWLDSLVATPASTGATMAETMANAIFSRAQAVPGNYHVATINLSQVGNLAAKASDLGAALSAAATDYWTEVGTARTSAYSSSFFDTGHVPLIPLVENLQTQTNLQNIALITTSAQAVVSAADQAVVANSPDVPGLTEGGFLIHFPDAPADYDSTDYAALDLGSTPWTTMISDFLEATTGITLTVTISPEGAGTVEVDPDQEYYEVGDVATLTAVPTAGYAFSHWVYEGDDYFGNPAELSFEGSDGTEDITAVFVEESQLVTITGTISRNDGNLVDPVLTLIDESLQTILGAFIFDGGSASVVFTVEFSPTAIAASHIHVWDNVNQNGTLGDVGDYSNCFDSDDAGIECDYVTYTAGMVIDIGDITVFEITESPHNEFSLPHRAARIGGSSH